MQAYYCWHMWMDNFIIILCHCIACMSSKSLSLYYKRCSVCSPMFPLLPRFLAIIAKTRIFPPSFKMSAGYPITFEIINKRWQPSLPITLSGVARHFVLFSDCNNTIFLRELCNGKTTIACLETPYFIHKDRICCWYSFAFWLSKTTNERCRLPQTWIQFGL